MPANSAISSVVLISERQWFYGKSGDSSQASYSSTKFLERSHLLNPDEDEHLKDVEDNERCLQPIEEGPCRSYSTRYAFDGARGACVAFRFGGCVGNDNRFNTIEECNRVCTGKQLFHLIFLLKFSMGLLSLGSGSPSVHGNNRTPHCLCPSSTILRPVDPDRHPVPVQPPSPLRLAISSFNAVNHVLSWPPWWTTSA